MKKIKYIALLLFVFACMNPIHAMLSRGVTRVQAPQSLFSRVMNKFSDWKTQFVRWYSGRRSAAYRTVVPSLKTRYSGPWYDTTVDWAKDWNKKHPLSVEESDYKNQNKRAFRVIRDIEGCDGLKKGDYVAVDGLHKDHLEVFRMINGKRKWIGAANFDGTKNEDKTKLGKKTFRAELE